jgi:hypothetical protein
MRVSYCFLIAMVAALMMSPLMPVLVYAADALKNGPP